MMQDYAHLYFTLILSRICSQMQYRVSFMLDTMGTLLINFADLLSIWIIMSHTPAIGGWTLEVALYGLVTASLGLHELIQGAFDLDVERIERIMPQPQGYPFNPFPKSADSFTQFAVPQSESPTRA